jgi:hypothetical protein
MAEHPYRQSAGPDEREVDELEAGLLRGRRRGVWRLVGVGVLVLLGGLAVLSSGMHAQHLQERSDVQFLLPTYLLLVGVFAAGLGVLLMLAALVVWLRRR